MGADELVDEHSDFAHPHRHFLCGAVRVVG